MFQEDRKRSDFSWEEVSMDSGLLAALGPGMTSCPFVWVVIKLADDASRSELGLLQIITAVAIAAEPSGLAQFVERASDLAAVLAADAFNNVRIEHRRRGQRLFDVLIARWTFEDIGGAAHQRNLPLAAERLGAIEAGLGAGTPAVERRVHGHAQNSL